MRARERIRDYLEGHGVAEEVSEDIVLAIEEAMTNAVRHSGAAGALEVRLVFRGSDLSIEVRDRGKGFDVSSFDPLQMPDMLQPGGRGLYLISRMMDELELVSDGGVSVQMLKRDALGSGSPLPPHSGIADGGALQNPQSYAQLRERSLVEEALEGFVALDWEYRLMYTNAAALDLYHMEAGDLIGKSAWDIFPQMKGSDLGRSIRGAMELGTAAITEYASPSIARMLEFRVYPTSSGVSLYIRDIEERKRKELAHDESRRRAELLARTTARLLSTDEPQTVIEDLCRDVMRHLGCHVFFNYLVDDGADRLCLNACAGIDEDEARRIEWLDRGVAVCGCCAQEAQRIVAEDIQHSDDGRAELVRSYGVQVYAAHPLIARDRVLGTLSFGARDRTTFTPDEVSLMKTVADHVAVAVERQREAGERRGAEEALRESEARFRLMADGLPLPVWVTDDEGELQMVNRTYRQFFGVAQGEVMGGRWKLLLHPDDAPRHSSEFLAATGERRPFQAEARARAAGGEWRWVESSAVPRFAADGSFLGMVGSSLDITERKQREARERQELEQSQLLLELGESLASRHSLTAVLRTLADLALDRVPHARVTVSLWDEERRVLTVRISQGAQAVAEGSETRFNDLSRPAQEVVERHVTRVIDYEALDHADLKGADRRSTHVALVVPLVYENRLLGLLDVDDPDERREFSEWQTHLAEGIASQASIAIENARLFAAETERARFAESLAEIDNQLRSSLDRHEMMRRAVAEGVRALGADSGAITLHREHGFIVAVASGFPEDPTGSHLSNELERHSLYAMERGEVVLVEDVSLDPRVDEAHLRSYGISAVIVVPLFIAGEAVGDLFFNFAGQRRFGKEEEEFARRLGSTLSLALDNARLYEDQQRIAGVLQENLIHPLPEIPGLELAVRSLPADQPELVGGDFSDVFVLDDGRVVIVIGDVAGKGVRAAGMTEIVRSTVRAYAALDPTPAFVARKTNELLLRHYLEESHVTALLCLLDPTSGRLSAVSAGHPAPIRLSPDSCSALDVPSGPPLGGFPTAYTTTRAQLTRDDCLVLFTDGVTDARRDGEQLGDDGLLEVVERLRGRSADEVAQAVADAALGFSGQLRDDLHVVVLRLA